jgi:hypothetical protein
VYLGHVQARLLWGGLQETDYTPMRAVEPRRFATGLVVVGTPRGLPGLEIGGGRFFEALWSDSISNTTLFTRVFSKIFKKEWGNPPGVANDNQLASIFARWVFPRSGMEFYGEFGHEDYPNNLRDFVSEPDHSSSYLIGMQHVRSRSEALQGESAPRRQVFRGELLNSRVNGLQITVVQQTYYTHPTVGQGHTNLGQVLGSVGAFGGGAAVLGYDSYTERGRWTVEYSRIMRAERRTNFHNMPDPEAADVLHALTFNGVRFRGRLALTYDATAVYELNRNFRDDVFNLRLASGVRYDW